MSETQMTPEKATALRKPFPRESIGQLPKGGQMLDFVGHAAVTDRLLTVDPEWSWEPMGVDQYGLPMPDGQGNLWIKLTVCGVTRIGVGDGTSMKERIGDAIRNAAMRFGVALDLWAKENLVEFAQAARSPEQQQAPTTPPPDPKFDTRGHPIVAASEVALTDKTRKRMFALFGELKIPEGEQLAGINAIVRKGYISRSQLTEADAQAVITRLVEKKKQAVSS